MSDMMESRLPVRVFPGNLARLLMMSWSFPLKMLNVLDASLRPFGSCLYKFRSFSTGSIILATLSWKICDLASTKNRSDGCTWEKHMKKCASEQGVIKNCEVSRLKVMQLLLSSIELIELCWLTPESSKGKGLELWTNVGYMF